MPVKSRAEPFEHRVKFVQSGNLDIVGDGLAGRGAADRAGRTLDFQGLAVDTGGKNQGHGSLQGHVGERQIDLRHLLALAAGVVDQRQPAVADGDFFSRQGFQGESRVSGRDVLGGRRGFLGLGCGGFEIPVGLAGFILDENDVGGLQDHAFDLDVAGEKGDQFDPGFKVADLDHVGFFESRRTAERQIAERQAHPGENRQFDVAAYFEGATGGFLDLGFDLRFVAVDIHQKGYQDDGGDQQNQQRAAGHQHPFDDSIHDRLLSAGTMGTQVMAHAVFP